MTVTALIINWNGQDYLLDTLASLTKFSDAPNIMVVDNGSEDNSVSLISQKYPKIELISNHEHLSFAQCLNFGLTQAMALGSQYIWLLGSDVLVNEEALKYLLELSEKYKDVGMVASKIYMYPDTDHKIYYAGGIMDWFSLAPTNRGNNQIDMGQFEHDVETDFVLPYSTLIKSRLINEVGLLDPVYYAGYDWLDYCFRVRRNSWRLMYSCQSHVWFKNMIHDDLPPNIKEYFSTRNQLLFGLRHAPPYTKLSLLTNAFHQYFFGHPWQRRGVLDFFTGNFGRGSYQTE